MVGCFQTILDRISSFFYSLYYFALVLESDKISQSDLVKDPVQVD